MAGFLDFVFSTSQQKEDRKKAERQAGAIRGALGRSPGVGPFLPGEGGSGLLADPTDPQNQIQFAGDVAAGGAPIVGSQLLSGIFSNTSAQTRQEAANQQSGENAILQAETSRSNAELQASVTREANAARLAASQAAGAGFGAGGGFDFGPVATGMVRTMQPQIGPDGQVFQIPVDIGLPGGAPHGVARDQLRGAQQSVDTVHSIRTLIDDEGFDLVGGSRAQFDFLRTSLQGELTEMLNLGVINSPAELKRLELLAPDAAAIRKLVGNFGIEAADNAIKAQYMLLESFMQQKYDEFAVRYSNWPGMDDLLPQPDPRLQ